MTIGSMAGLKIELKVAYIHVLDFSVDCSQHVTCYSQSRGEPTGCFIKRCRLPGDKECTVSYQQPLYQMNPVLVSTVDRGHPLYGVD
jgi:hypothetical protein